MIDATNLFTDRIAKLEREINGLRQEQAMLYKFQRLLGQFPQVLRGDDRFTSRTATKFELLARVVTHLSRPDPFMYGGASTKEIYGEVIADIASDRRATDRFNADPDRIERGDELKFFTPLESDDEIPNYNTFRSYLARYRDEGRIFFDEETRRWRVTEKKITVETADEEEAHDRS